MLGRLKLVWVENREWQGSWAARALVFPERLTERHQAAESRREQCGDVCFQTITLADWRWLERIWEATPQAS